METPTNTQPQRSSELPKQREIEKAPLTGDILLVFGQGPVIDSDSRLKAGDAMIAQGKEDVSFLSQDQANAASLLYKRGAIKNIVNLGGNTGGKDPEGKDYKSEAELIADYMVKFGIPESAIGLEQLSNDTLENIRNFLNIYDTHDEIKKQGFQFDILVAPFHGPRVNILMQLFDLPVRHTFHSTEVIRYAARAVPGGGDVVGLTTDSSQWNNEELSRIEDMVDLNDPTKYSKQKKGSESRDILDRYVKDEMWTRELLEYPEKWLPEVGKILNSNRVGRILQKVEVLYPGMLKDKYDIVLSGLTVGAPEFDEITSKLKNIPAYLGLSGDIVEQWKASAIAGEEWPEDTKRKRDALLAMQ